MPYQRNIPNPNDVLSNSQGDILGNFQSNYDAFTANHGAFDGPTAGQHTVVQMPVQAAIPNPPFALTDIGLFNLVDDDTGISELTYKTADANATLDRISITASILSYATPGNISSGWTVLPSGVLLKWGANIAVAQGGQTINFPVSANIPVFNACFSVLANTYNPAGVWSSFVFGITPTGFDSIVRNLTLNQSVAGNINYLAIGY